MQWEISGADRTSGADKTITIEADNEASATRRANRRGLVVASCRPLDPSDSAIAIAKPPPMPVPVPLSYRRSVRAVEKKPVNGLGVAALIIGIIATLVCWIPFIGMASIPFAILGLVLAIVGLIVSLSSKRTGFGMPLAGGIVCGCAILLSVTSTLLLVGGVGNAVVQLNAQQQQHANSAAPLAPVIPAQH